MAAAVLLALMLFLPLACGSSSSPSPFVSIEAGTDGGDTDGGDVPPPPTAEPDAAPPPDVPGEWGGPCVDDGNCDDAIDCTVDSCDHERERCHFVAEPERCDDSVFCNGAERCVLGVGCRAGEAEACSDGTTCTIDACDELTRTCSHALRDADGDGDSDGNCPGGSDCNDQDDDVSSKHVEICDNGVDDDCDGERDETACESPKYDTCKAPLLVTAPATYRISALAAKTDYSASCATNQSPLADVVLQIRVPKGDPVDIDVGVTTETGDVELAAFTKCGDPSTEVACGIGAPGPRGSQGSRILLHSPPPGDVFVVLFTNAGQPVAVRVDYPAATPPPANETCGTAIPLTEGEHVTAPLASAARDVPVGCAQTQSDLVYSFTLTEPRDVRVSATAEDVFGVPVLSLRRAPCDGKTSELTCLSADNAQLYRRALPAGDYLLVVASTGPSTLDVVLETSAPTEPAADENCKAAPLLEPNVDHVVDLAAHEDDVAVKCAASGADAAYTLSLDAPSDVLLVLGIADNDVGGVSLAAPSCSGSMPPIACRTRSLSPIRTSARGLAAGDYRVVAESAVGTSVALAAFVRPAAPPVLVAFSDGCDEATEIPEAGGAFLGTTENSTDDYSASCDVGGSDGSPDQFLSFHLAQKSRVILDARGSSFAVILDVRHADACPGEEVPFGCSAGYIDDRSFVDVTLPAGDYRVQIDGYLGQSGAWTLDAFISPAE